MNEQLDRKLSEMERLENHIFTEMWRTSKTRVWQCPCGFAVKLEGDKDTVHNKILEHKRNCGRT